MATTIKVKRKVSPDNTGIKLNVGEPYYNLAEKRLYIGNQADDEVSQKKHIAEVTDVSDSDGVKFQIGEDETNVIDLGKAGISLNTHLTWKPFPQSDEGN